MLKQEILAEIQIAEKECLRLQTEIEQIAVTVPEGTCIGSYRALSGWYGIYYQYFSLNNKGELLPCRMEKNENKLTKKLHIGTDINPNYRDAALLIEATRIRKIKEETLTHLFRHKEALEKMYERLLAKEESDKEVREKLYGKLLVKEESDKETDREIDEETRRQLDAETKRQMEEFLKTKKKESLWEHFRRHCENIACISNK